MKRILQRLSLLTLLLIGAMAPLAAAASDNLVINISVTIRTLALEWADTAAANAPRDWTLNAVWNGTYDTNTHGTTLIAATPTALSGLPNRFNIKNVSGAPVDIAAAVAAGNWTPGTAVQQAADTANICVLSYSANASAYTQLTTASLPIKGTSALALGVGNNTALADAATLPFDLQIVTPTSASSSNTSSGALNVTLTATIAP